MTAENFARRVREICAEQVPQPGTGSTAERHEHLMRVAREDVSLAKIVEAHWDAVAILAEAGRSAEVGVVYAVWASEIPGKQIILTRNSDGSGIINGAKMFSSGAGLVDRALMIVGEGEPQLIDVDLRTHAARIAIDGSNWKTTAFALTQTATLTFRDVPVAREEMICSPGWYLSRPGFWNGACGPAACWAGGAQGLLDWAMRSKRSDPHTLAHLAAISAECWGMHAVLQQAGREIDASPAEAPMARALQVRYLIERACTEVLRRFARAYGPHPLAMDEAASRRYAELDLYLRQSHAERDLEALGHALRS